jgi:hypothetical protein
LLCVAALPTLVACQGGGGGSPTAPSGVLDVHGDWSSVVITVVGGEPQGQCWADHLNSIAGAHGDNRMAVQQNGSAVTIAITSTFDPQAHEELAGTVGESSLMATDTQQPPDFEDACDSGERFEFHPASGQLSLSGSSTHLTGEMAETLELSQGGVLVATVTAHFSVTAVR